MVAPFRARPKLCFCGHSKSKHRYGMGECVGCPTHCKRYRSFEKKYATAGKRDSKK